MPRTSFGLQSIDQKLTNLLKPIFSGSKKKFILVNNLAKNWSEIIGKKYAELCYPKSVSFGKEVSSNGKLTIAVHNPAVGFFLESNSELILERIAAFYGFKSIGKIIIKQEPKELNAKPLTKIHLPPEKEKILQEIIKNIDDQSLAETLQKLGREVLGGL